MCIKKVRLYEMSLPNKLADELEQLACVLGISRGEAMARAILLLSLAVGSDKVLLTKNNRTTNVLVK